MVSVISLWLPILVAAVLVFVASAVWHMLLPYHNSDFRSVPSEDDVMGALRRFNIPPGDYVMPRPTTAGQMRDPEFLARRERGPVALFTVLPPGPPTMGKQLAMWFVYCVVASVFAGYVAGIGHGPGTDPTTIFRVAGTVAFATYSLGLWQDSIWYGKAWRTTLTSTFDGVSYALLTGGAFAWMWPR